MVPQKRPRSAARLVSVFLGCAALVSAPGCRVGGGGPAGPRDVEALEKNPWGDPQHVIVEVNGRAITRGEFYQRILRRFGSARLLAGIIKEELFIQEAERLGLQVTPPEVDAKLEEILKDMARDAGGDSELARIYEREGIRLEDLRRDLEREVPGQILVGKVTKSLRQVDEAALQKYYQETYRYTRYRTRHIAYSFLPKPGQAESEKNRLKLEAYQRAARAADRIRKGADFAALARAESEDSVTASRGGELGPIHQDSPMDPAMKKVILGLASGEVSDPVENPSGGYHIFQVMEVIPGESYVDCKEKMRVEILEKEPDLGEIEKALMTLRDRASVRIFGAPYAGEEKVAPAGGSGPEVPKPAGAAAKPDDPRAGREPAGETTGK